MIFKKKALFIVSIMLMLSVILAACGGGGKSTDGNASSDGKTYNWKFVTEELQGQLQYEYAAEFAKRLKEKSNGKIKIDVYEFGGLGDEVNQVEQLQNQAVQFAIVSPGFTGTMVKEGQIFALHFLFPDDLKKTQDILNTSKALNVDLAKKYEENNIKPLAFWTEGATQWTSNKPLKTPADFNKFKMRTQESPLIMKSYEAYGANPTPMSWGELYTALDRGTVEGQENPIFFIKDASFNEVQDYMTISKHNVYTAMTTVNPTFYNGLPDDIKKMIDDTVKEMQPWIFNLQKQMNTDMLKEIKNDTANPTEVITLTEKERAAFKEKALPVRDYYKKEVSTVNGEILDKLVKEIEAAK